MKIIINLALVLVAAILLTVDYSSTKETENLVVATCDTKVAYDKSGDLYCMDQTVTPATVKVARK